MLLAVSPEVVVADAGLDWLESLGWTAKCGLMIAPSEVTAAAVLSGGHNGP